jgi:integrase
VGLPKTKASKGPVPLHPLLAEFLLSWKQKTPYSQPGDWVFASFRLNGKQPRVANMLVEDYLRPAAAKAGILSSHRDDCGRLVEDDPRRFGFHNLRHSLARSWFASEQIRRPYKLCFATAMSNGRCSFTATLSARIAWPQREKC